MAFVRARRSNTFEGRRIDYAFKQNKSDAKFKDVPVKFIKGLEKFELSFAKSFWLSGEKKEILKRWESKTTW